MDGARVAVTGNRKGAELAASFARRGAQVLHGATLSGDEAAPEDELLADTRAVVDAKPHWFVATTGVGMRMWSDVADRNGLGDDLRGVASLARCAARGAKARGGLRGLGVDADWVSPNNTDADVMSWLSHRLLPGDTVVVQLHGGVSTAYEPLTAAGFDLLTVLPYRWGLPADPEPARDIVRAAVAAELDVVAFTSAGAVQNLFTLARGIGLADRLAAALAGDVAVASVGPVTAEAVEQHGGVNTVVPRRWRQADLVRCVEEWWTRRHVVPDDLGLRLQPHCSSVAFDDVVVTLGTREYAVLAALSRRPGILVRTDELLAEVWGHEAPSSPTTVKHQIARLRRKLAASDVRITTVRGLGYRMEAA